MTQSKALLFNDDVLVRQLTSQVLILFARHAVGRASLLEAQIPSHLVKSFDDADVLVRQRVHEVISLLCTLQEGAERIITLGLVPKLVDKLKQESGISELLVAILTTLHHCLLINQNPCLECDAMETFLSLTTSSDDQVAFAAVRAVKDLRYASACLSFASSSSFVLSIAPVLVAVSHADIALLPKAKSRPSSWML